MTAFAHSGELTSPIDAASPISRDATATEGRLTIEFWTVAMDEQTTCGSCDDTFSVVNQALETLRPLASQLGFSLQLATRGVATWADAIDNGIVASPTLRAANLELRPSHPDSSEARLWNWRGTTTPTATPAALLDFLLRALAARSEQIGNYLASGGPPPYIRQFLHSGTSLDRTPATTAPTTGESCSPSPSAP